MYKHITVLAVAFVLLVSCASSATVPIVTAKRDIVLEVSVVDNRHTDSDFDGLSLPIKTSKLFECPPGWKFFCFHDEEGNESRCECYKMIGYSKDCPDNTNKNCSDYIKTECSCSYAKQPNCQPIFDFTCLASTSPGSTWKCTCAGKVWGKAGCPSGFKSHCGSKGCACKKVTKFLSDYTPKPKSGKGFSTEVIGKEDHISDFTGSELKR